MKTEVLKRALEKIHGSDDADFSKGVASVLLIELEVEREDEAVTRAAVLEEKAGTAPGRILLSVEPNVPGDVSRNFMKIHAIKLIREILGVGLIEAKNMIELAEERPVILCGPGAAPGAFEPIIRREAEPIIRRFAEFGVTATWEPC